MNYRKVATALATGALLLQTTLPSFAATELIISGNGSDADSTVQVSDVSSTTVVQTNTTDVDNDIDVDTNTGNNKADDNTGGDVQIHTGDADAYVEVTNQLNTNVADVENCGGCDGDSLVLIEGNGSGSENQALLEDLSVTQVFQDNIADVDNDVDVDLETGDNEAKDNTGGAVAIVTGDADAIVKVHTAANSNAAMVAGSGDESGSVALAIVGNGSDSKNRIALGLQRLNLVRQTNVTDIDNDVDVDADTGGNEIKDTTGGETAIGTGDANAKVVVDNMAGFNHAYIDDCCFEDVLAKVSGNGTDTKNEIRAELAQDLSVFQDNVCGHGWGWPWPMPGRGDFLEGDMPVFWPGPWWDQDCFDNDVDLDLETGDNEIDDSTGEPGTDPLIITGDSDVEVHVDNAGGSNSYGDYMPSMPDMGEWGGISLDLEFSFSLSDLLAALMG